MLAWLRRILISHMPRFIFILLLFTNTALAQSLPSSAPVMRTNAVATRLTVADTVQAIHKLFHQRRTGGRWGLGLAVGTLLTPYIIGTATETDKRWVKSGAYLNVGFIVSLPLWVLAGGKSARYSARRQAELVESCKAGQPLPRKIRNRLARRYFKQ